MHGRGNKASTRPKVAQKYSVHSGLLNMKTRLKFSIDIHKSTQKRGESGPPGNFQFSCSLLVNTCSILSICMISICYAVSHPEALWRVNTDRLLNKKDNKHGGFESQSPINTSSTVNPFLQKHHHQSSQAHEKIEGFEQQVTKCTESFPSSVKCLLQIVFKSWVIGEP